MTVPAKALSEEALDQILAEYIAAADAGTCPDRQEWLRRYPQAADALTDFFADQDRFRQRVAPLRDCVAGSLAAGTSFPEAGTRVGSYELLEEIARGGMGIVFRARQVDLNRTVALKMILAGTLATPAEQQRFRLEAESAAKLDHPNIVPIYETGTWQDQPYFSMRLVERGSLAHWLATGQTANADWRDLAQLLATVARAVHHAHQCGILHRDLKPGNILLHLSGTDGLRSATPMVSDFGLAQGLPREPGAADVPVPAAMETANLAAVASSGEETPIPKDRLTQSGVVVGTPSYMAPEQVAWELAPSEKRSTRGPGLTTATDVYSLGAVLYEVLTGKPPFRAATMRETLRCVAEEPPTPPRRHNPGVPSDLEAICLKCLEKDPGRRYGSAAALADDLERYLRGEPVEARPLSAIRRGWRWCRRQPALALSCALSVAGLICVTVVSVLFAWSEARSRARLDEAANRLQAALDDTREQKRLAEENYDKAHRAIVDFYVRSGYEKFEQRMGVPEPLQKDLLQTALKHFQDFLKQKEGDPTLRFEVAQTWSRIGHISYLLGSPVEALNCTDRALEICEQLATEGTQTTNLRFVTASLHANRRQILAVLDRMSESLACAEKAADGYRSLCMAFPTHLVYQHCLGAILSDISNHHRLTGQLEKALELSREAQSILGRLVTRFRENADYQASQARLFDNRGHLHVALGRQDQACQEFEQAIKIVEELTRRFPQSALYQYQLALIYRNLGSELVRQGKNQQGWPLLQQSETLLDQLVTAHPNMVQYVVSWAITQRDLGRRHRAVNDEQKVRECQQRLYDRLEALKTRHEGIASFRQMLAFAYYAQGVFHLQQKNPAQAAALLKRALQMRQQLVKESPTRPEYRFDLGESLHVRGKVLAAAGKPEEAIASFRQAIDLSRSNLLAARHDPAVAQTLLRYFTTLARFQQNAGRPDEGIRSWQEACELIAQLTNKHGGIPTFRISLAQARVDYGIDLARNKRPRDATLVLSQACQDWEMLLAIHEKESLVGQADCHFQLGVIRASNADDIAATRHYEQALAFLTKAMNAYELRFQAHATMVAILNNLGLSYLRQNKLKASVDTLRQGLAYQRRVPDVAPKNGDQPSAQTKMVMILTNLGLAYLMQNKLEASIDMLRQAVIRQRRVLEMDPKSAAERKLLAQVYQILANALHTADKRAEALTAKLEQQKLTDEATELFVIAQDLGGYANAVGQGKTKLAPQEQAERDRIADLAVQALRQALARGLKDLTEVDRLSEFAAVRVRPGFQQLVQEQKK
jgi:serine/threonine-protein kinase